MIPEYGQVLAAVRDYGFPVAPRGIPTREHRNSSMSFLPGEILARKGASIPLMFAEGLMALGGFFDVEAVKAVAPKAAHGLFTAEMAYGPRLNAEDQMERVISALQADPSSREAFVHLGQPSDPMGIVGQIPCWESVQFLIRDGRLETTAVFRSLDLVVGLPVDVVIVGMVALATAAVLGVPTGRVTLQAASAHIYESSIEAGKLENPRVWGRFQLPIFVRQADSWWDVREWAKAEMYSHWMDQHPESKWPPCLVVEQCP